MFLEKFFPFALIGSAALWTRAAAVCTSPPGFVNANPAAAFADPVTETEEGYISNNHLVVAVRYAPGAAPQLVETNNNGAGNTVNCFKFIGSSGTGWIKTTDTTTRSDGCYVDVYNFDLQTYLTSPAPASGYGCGTTTTGTATLATTIGHFNLQVNDVGSGAASGGQSRFANPLAVRMLTPLQMTAQTSLTASASAQFDANSLSVTAYYTRQDLGNVGMFRLLWSVNLSSNWKNLAYDTPQITLPAAATVGTIVGTTIGTAPTQVWSGELDVPITNFCSGFNSAGGSYTLNFKTGTGASTPNTPGSISFVMPTTDLCATYSPVQPSLSLATYDASTDLPASSLQLGSSYYWLATVTSLYGISSISFVPDATKMVSTSGAAVTYNILPGSPFYSNQLMSRADTAVATGYTVKVFFTVENGPGTDPATDWFFLANEIPSTGSSVSKSFQTTFALSVQYADGQLNTHARRDVVVIPNTLSAETSFTVQGDKSNSAGVSKRSLLMMGSLTVVSVVAMLIMG